MAISSSLEIKQISKKNNKYSFDCIGSIDANAQEPLQILHDLPPEIQVALDFSNIERVNSMGLSLLLKVFEEWESVNTEIEISNLNRMVSMLFKITGLGRFIQGNTDTAAGNTDKKIANPTPPKNVSTKDSSTSLDETKLNFIASIQSGHQLSGWYLFNTYLQRKMHRAIHFEQLQEVKNEAFHLFFATPFDACDMMKKKGFIPLVRPVCDADEVVILARADDTRELLDFKDKKSSVVTADEGSFVYLLGRFLCDENGLDSTKFAYEFTGNEIKALQMLIRKKADIAFLLKSTYEKLSSFSRKNVRQLDESATDFAFHQFCIAPNLKNKADELSNILIDMKNDENGKQILKDIQFEEWIKPEEGELKMLNLVFDRYTK